METKTENLLKDQLLSFMYNIEQSVDTALMGESLTLPDLCAFVGDKGLSFVPVFIDTNDRQEILNFREAFFEYLKLNNATAISTVIEYGYIENEHAILSTGIIESEFLQLHFDVLTYLNDFNCVHSIEIVDYQFQEIEPINEWTDLGNNNNPYYRFFSAFSHYKKTKTNRFIPNQSIIKYLSDVSEHATYFFDVTETNKFIKH